MSCYAFTPTIEEYGLQRDGFHVKGQALPFSNITMFCQDEKAATFSTDNGTFSISASCRSGKDVYLEINHKTGTYRTGHLKVKHAFSARGAHGVPEFSGFGLATAAVSAALGIIILRKSGGIK